MSLHRLSVATPAPARQTPLGADDVAVTTRNIVIGGTPRMLVSGEIHFSRIPRSQWRRTLVAARAGGLTHIATYVFWNHHEPEQGHVSFDGDLDLRHFLRIAEDLGLGIVLRVGPYVHAESRHGGLPDWLVRTGVTLRSDDPRYLAEAERWYAALAEQVRDINLFAVQVDNELYDRPEHLATLRRMAQRVGVRAPLWTATAWGGADVPPDVLGMYGGYTDSFWIDASITHDERSASNFYPTLRRDDDSIGADHREVMGSGSADLEATPFVTCELGSGMVSAYHRRPHVVGADIDAVAMTKLASGSVWQGYYMYSDGRNPGVRLQENHADGDPNDFLDIGYDFSAPLTVDGAPRESWYLLRRQHEMLRTWSRALADMPATIPLDAPDVPDIAGLRWSVRSDGHRGFLFGIGHQPHTLLAAHPDTRFVIETEAGAVRFPSVDIPQGATFVWPFRLAVGDALIEWATAQPITETMWRGAPLVVLAEVDGVEVDFAVDLEAHPMSMSGPGRWWEVRAADESGVRARILVLSVADSLQATTHDGTLVLTDGVIDGGGAFAYGEVSARRLTEAGWSECARAVVDAAELHVSRTRAAGAAPLPRLGPMQRASVPTDWTAAATFEVALPELPTETAATVVIEWEGDLARAWRGDHLVSDAIYNGNEWRIPWVDCAGEDAGAAPSVLRIDVLPQAEDAPVFVGTGRPDGARVVRAHCVQVAEVRLPE
ncbi:beta-galactosidase [Microbacterium sp. C7(2022)]|uniref:beta-galactosidase n=1 Tax=Microbacterium sp. C7(2022) TaxID=2992759 RepID=UPI00237AA88F|nr:beta-galactosidase [Microbacterium sp. C7(2022)]MDE0547074.1 beta-galactosidase [Microbacterium sp. C7(2022)]